MSMLVSYGMAFASFLLDSRAGPKIRRIILFGSAARGDADEASDVDIFVDTGERIEKEVDKLLALFNASQLREKWRMRGAHNEISVKVGSLKAWSLRREVISSGIVLYGKCSDFPEKMQYYLLVILDLGRMPPSRKMSIWRKLYGYRQKVGEKVYAGRGLLEKAGGRKLGKAVFLVPMERRREILDFLRKNKVKCALHELWSDTFS